MNELLFAIGVGGFAFAIGTVFGRRLRPRWLDFGLPYWLFVIALGLVGAFFLWPTVMYLWSPIALPTTASRQDLGQFGDMFGGLTAFLTSFTLLALLATIRFERREAAKQSFESNFFQLMQLFRDSKFRKLREGRFETDADVVAANLARAVVTRSHHLKTLSEAERRSELWSVQFGPRYGENDDQLGPFFRCVYHWFKFVSQSAPEAADELRYAHLARAQFSNTELILIGINCLAYKDSGLKEFVTRYGLLKHLRDPSWDIKIREVLEWFYPSEAFGAKPAS